VNILIVLYLVRYDRRATPWCRGLLTRARRWFRLAGPADDKRQLVHVHSDHDDALAGVGPGITPRLPERPLDAGLPLRVTRSDDQSLRSDQSLSADGSRQSTHSPVPERELAQEQDERD
jgi:hypothetical protein